MISPAVGIASLAGGAAAVGAAVGVVGVGVGAWGMFLPRSRLFGPVVAHGPRDCGAVALTFDDGPHPTTTPVVMDVLREQRAPAAFFVIGAHAARYPELVRRAHAEGHLIANHSLDHHRAGMFRFDRYWYEQVARTQGIIQGIVGENPTFFRPPMGFKSPHLMRAARSAGCRVVAWSWTARDGISARESSILKRGERVGAGDILVLHDGRDRPDSPPPDSTVAALPGLIEIIRGRGLRIERLDHLLGPRQASPDPRTSHEAPSQASSPART